MKYALHLQYLLMHSFPCIFKKKIATESFLYFRKKISEKKQCVFVFKQFELALAIDLSFRSQNFRIELCTSGNIVLNVISVPRKKTHIQI